MEIISKVRSFAKKRNLEITAHVIHEEQDECRKKKFFLTIAMDVRLFIG